MDGKKYIEQINSIRRGLLARIGEVHEYRDWSDELSRQEIDDKFEWLRAFISLSNSQGSPELVALETRILCDLKMGRVYPVEKLKEFVNPDNLLPLPPSIFGAESIPLMDSMLLDWGFGRWDENLWLIPIWMKPFINPKVEVVSINGKTVPFSEVDNDNDNRGGLLAYGFYNYSPDKTED